MAVTLILSLLGVTACLVVLNANHILLAFRCGVLAKTSDEYLGGTGRIFQQISWHVGNATRTWGETYGVKLGRVYVSAEVRHLNPLVKPEDAGE